jgi:hypothetical protein
LLEVKVAGQGLAEPFPLHDHEGDTVGQWPLLVRDNGGANGGQRERGPTGTLMVSFKRTSNVSVVPPLFPPRHGLSGATETLIHFCTVVGYNASRTTGLPVLPPEERRCLPHSLE